jgi:hypothetical protein
MNEGRKEGRKKKEAIELSPLPSPSTSFHPSLPANFWEVTHSEVPIHTFQRPKTLKAAITTCFLLYM